MDNPDEFPPYPEIVNDPDVDNPTMTGQECSTKRIPVSPGTWETVHQLRKAGETYDDVIRNLIRRDSEARLIEETTRIRKRGKYLPLSEIRK